MAENGYLWTAPASGLLVGLLLLSASIPAGAAIGMVDHEQSVTANSSVSTVLVGESQSRSTEESRTIGLTQALQLTPDMPGEIAVTLQYSIPADVVELKTRLPADVTVTATDGFVQRDGGEYTWDRQTSAPSLTYRVPVNETLDVTGPIAGKGNYTFVDKGNWALVRVPPTATGWSWTGSGAVGISRSTTAAGQGAVGDAMAFLGEHREVTRTAHGQTFRLIIPAQASLTETPTRILDSMAAASNTLRVGDRDERVFMVVAPTKASRWGVRGLQTGDSDMWVRDIERLDSADNTWLHEYVHTRQGYAAANDVRWFTEASASYYAALLTLEQNRIGFEAFRNRLALGKRTPDASAVLADPATWDTVAPYTKGALVAGELDRQTRHATNRTWSLQDILSRMNRHSDSVTRPVFYDIVRQAGGDTTMALADRYTTTRETPEVWNQTTHAGAFDTTPARIGYRLSAAETQSGYRVSGPYRNESLDSKGPLDIAVGETLTIDVNVSNSGGTAGEYDAPLLVNGERQSRQTGSLGSGETKTLTFTHRFSTPGTYTVTAGDHTVTVSVRQPVSPEVTAIQVRSGQQQQDGGRELTVVATVRNDRTFPAATNLTLYQNGDPVETRRVTLAPTTKRNVNFDNLLAGPGDHLFRVANQMTTVQVKSTATVRSKTTSMGADGFGTIPALVAVVGLVVVFACRQ